MEGNNETLLKIASKIQSKIKYIEIIALLFVFLAWIVQTFNIALGLIVFIPILLLLAIVYFLLSFSFPFQELNPFNVFLRKLSFMALAVVNIGTVFFILNFPNYKTMLSVGGATLFIASLLFVFQVINGKSKYPFSFYPFLIRNFVFSLISAVVLLIV